MTYSDENSIAHKYLNWPYFFRAYWYPGVKRVEMHRHSMLRIFKRRAHHRFTRLVGYSFHDLWKYFAGFPPTWASWLRDDDSPWLLPLQPSVVLKCRLPFIALFLFHTSNWVAVLPHGSTSLPLIIPVCCWEFCRFWFCCSDRFRYTQLSNWGGAQTPEPESRATEVMAKSWDETDCDGKVFPKNVVVAALFFQPNSTLGTAGPALFHCLLQHPTAHLHWPATPINH